MLGQSGPIPARWSSLIASGCSRVPEYRVCLEDHEAEGSRAVAHDAHRDYQSLPEDLMRECDWLGAAQRSCRVVGLLCLALRAGGTPSRCLSGCGP